jgi:glycerate 2-kinase
MREPTAQDLVDGFRAAVAAAEPGAAVRAALACVDGVVTVGSDVIGRFDPDHIVVVGIGKAAAAMADAASEITGAVRGIVATPYPSDSSFPVLVGGHPIPNDASLLAGRALLELVGSLGSNELVIAVVSGGGSAAAEVPALGVSLADLQEMNKILVASGAPIEEINQVRAAVSRLKAGGLRSSMSSATVVTLVLSDVVNGGSEMVASGPTIPSALGSIASEIIEAHGLGAKMPKAITDAIQRFVPNEARPDDVVVVVGSSAMAADAALRSLQSKGLNATIATAQLTGDVEDAVAELLAASKAGSVWIAAGETTVNVTGHGVGGRNQHAALIAAVGLAGTGGAFGAFGTDGIDGPTGVAGAVVDGSTVEMATHRGWDVATELAAHNSNTVLADIGSTIETGPTGTNVGDLWLWFVGA